MNVILVVWRARSEFFCMLLLTMAAQRGEYDTTTTAE